MIILNGRAGSGKSLVAKLIGEHISYKVLNVSDIVKKVSKSANRDKLQETYKLTEKDNNWLVRAIIEEVGDDDNIILVGFREVHVQRELQKIHPSILIHIECPTAIRKSRMAMRDSMTEEEFIKYEEGDAHLGINLVMNESADLVINTARPLEVMKSIIPSFAETAKAMHDYNRSSFKR